MTPAGMRNLFPIRSQIHGSPGLLWFVLLATLMIVSGNTSEATAQTAPAPTGRLIERYPATQQLLHFEGRIEASQRAAVSTRLDGVVETIHFKGGEVVEQGDLLISLDPTDAQLALQAAEADLQRAKARLTLAEQDSSRVAQLVKRGNATLQRQEQVAAEVALARAELATAKVSIKRAETNLERASIRAPIAGRITRPRVTLGAFIEAEEAPPLAEILQLQPVVVAYDVPYADRLSALQQGELLGTEEMLPLVTLRLQIANDFVLPETAKPNQVAAKLNEDGTVTIRAPFDNPKGLLRPGLRVQVLSELDEEATEILKPE